MANLSITAGNVLPGANAKIEQGIAGAALTAGQPVYQDSADSNRLKPAAANNAATANVVGIVLQNVGSGQRVEYVREDDDFSPGATLSLAAAGDRGTYVLAATAGMVAPVADLVAGNRYVPLFVAKSTSRAVLRIVNTGAAIS